MIAVRLLAVCPILCIAAGWAPAAEFVTESARQIPVAATADVVVVGGTTGAVAAAVAAAKSGAKVFLLAPRTYLGEDMAGTMQLWAEPDEKPAGGLGAALYADPAARTASGLPFTYRADRPTNAKHKDTQPPSALCPEQPPQDPQRDSVQYDEDVTITADLRSSRRVQQIRVVSFTRRGDFQAGSIRVQTSDDGKAWKDRGSVPAAAIAPIATTSIPVDDTVRHVRLTVTRAAGAKRLLLGAIEFLPPAEPASAAPARLARPLHVKKTLENALLAANVEFLFGCLATELLVDRDGQPAGVVMSNRAGRQAVIGKVLLDTTEHAVVARLAGAEFTAADSPITQSARWVVIAEKARSAAGVKVRQLPLPVRVFDANGKRVTDRVAHWFEYSIPSAPANNTWPAQAEWEQAVRDRTYDASQLYSADVPWRVPAEAIRAAAKPPQDWPGTEKIDLGVFQPRKTPRVWVLSGHAGLLREQAEEATRPMAQVELGTRLGVALALQARRLAAPAAVRVDAPAAVPAGEAAEVREVLGGLRPVPAPALVLQAARALPVLGQFDVVVVGGGTSGAPAGIAAARHGAKALVVEYLHGLGGVGTLGMIGKFWYGNRQGFTATVPQNPLEVRMEFYRRELRRAGAEIWFGAISCGALVEGGRVGGVVVATPWGRGAVLAKTVIDATGNAELAAAAGAATQFVEDNFVVQKSHMPPREVGSYYINGNIEAVDVSDPLDVRATLLNHPLRSFDRSPLIDSRERQRVVGDYTLDWLDQINRRTFPDSVVLAASDYDSHGAQVHPYFMLKPSRPPGDYRHTFFSYVPYRCLLPKGLENLLVVGLGVSAHRDALPIIRMQPDLGNMGYAAGTAAAMAVKAGIAPRRIDVRRLQKHLVEVGNLPERVLSDGDSYPIAPEKIQAAIRQLPSDYDGLEIVLAQPADALPPLRAAYAAANAADRLAYAHVLGVMGDAAGLESLIAEAQRRLETPSLLALPEAGRMDDVTRLLWALGGTGDSRALPVLAQLAERAVPGSSVRLRALAVSLGRKAKPDAAPILANLLTKHVAQGSAAELIAACALFRCGDQGGAAQSALKRIAAGSNGPFARLAWQVLSPDQGR